MDRWCLRTMMQLEEDGDETLSQIRTKMRENLQENLQLTSVCEEACLAGGVCGEGRGVAAAVCR